MTATPAMDSIYVPKDGLIIAVHGPTLDQQQQQPNATPAIIWLLYWELACICCELEKW